MSSLIHTTYAFVSEAEVFTSKAGIEWGKVRCSESIKSRNESEPAKYINYEFMSKDAYLLTRVKELVQAKENGTKSVIAFAGTINELQSHYQNKEGQQIPLKSPVIKLFVNHIQIISGKDASAFVSNSKAAAKQTAYNKQPTFSNAVQELDDDVPF